MGKEGQYYKASMSEAIKKPERINPVTRVFLTASLVAAGLKAATTARAMEQPGARIQNYSEIGPVVDEKPIPKLPNGNYEFFSIAKMRYEIDPKTGQGGWVNSVEPGEKGYVYGIDRPQAKWVFPLRVAGYYFVQEEHITGPGVTLMEYREISPNKSK